MESYDIAYNPATTPAELAAFIMNVLLSSLASWGVFLRRKARTPGPVLQVSSYKTLLACLLREKKWGKFFIEGHRLLYAIEKLTSKSIFFIVLLSLLITTWLTT